MPYVDNNVPVIEKITLPSGNSYYIADREIRNVVATLSEAIAGGVSFAIAWDGTSTPDVGNIPEGVVVTYNGTSYTGTLDADNAQPGAFYLVKSKTQVNGMDVYDEYVPVGSDGSKTWEKIGDTQIDLSNVVTGVTLSKQTDTVIGTDATFTITQPTIALATGATAGAGVISVATGIGTITDPDVSLSENNANDTGRVEYVKSLNTTKLKTTVSGGSVAWNSKDSKTALTGVKVTAQPTVSLTANNSDDTGRITYLESQGSATTTKLSATADITGKTGSAASSVTPTTKKLATSSVTGVQSNTTTASKATAGTAQTTATGGWTAVSASSTDANENGNPDVNENLLANISVSNGILSIGAATLDTQSTPQYTFSDVTVPIKANSATTVATGSVTTSGSGADVVTDVEVGNTITVVTAAPDITIAANNSTGDVTVATGIGAGTTKYLSASASGTAVGADGTASVIGASSTFTHTNPSVTIVSDANTGDVTIVNSGNTKYLDASASGTAVAATTTNIKATASGANTAWNNKDSVTVLKSDTDVSVTKGNS